jgi:hypothetical protein
MARNGIAGSPYEIRAGADGDVWVLTYRPDGLSRWSHGDWTHFPISHNSSGAFALAGKQVWVASGDGIQHFDGAAWRKMPVTVRESVAIAAEGNEVWIVGNLGMLTNCVGDHCETYSITDQIPDYAWRSNVLTRTRKLGNKTLVRAFARLWFIHNVVWFSSDGQKWTQWLGRDNARVWPVGCSGGRIWMKTWDSLRAIGEDLQATEFPLDPLSATSVYDFHSDSVKEWAKAPTPSRSRLGKDSRQGTFLPSRERQRPVIFISVAWIISPRRRRDRASSIDMVLSVRQYDGNPPLR